MELFLRLKINVFNIGVPPFEFVLEFKLLLQQLLDPIFLLLFHFIDLFLVSVLHILLFQFQLLLLALQLLLHLLSLFLVLHLVRFSIGHVVVYSVFIIFNHFVGILSADELL